MDSEKLLILSEKLSAEITASKDDLLLKFPMEKYIESIKNYPKYSSLSYVGREVEDISKRIVEYSNENVLSLFHQLILVNLIIEARETIFEKKLKKDILSFYNINFERIYEEIESKCCSETYVYSNGKFRKDLALCALRRIPVGAVKINLRELPKGIFAKGGTSQLIKAMMFVVFDLGGFGPLFEMHMDSYDPHLMANFNETGWTQSYIRMSEILEIYPNVKGVFGASWLFDPELEHISPRLLYLRRIPTDNGGKLFYFGRNSQSIKEATFKSQTRRRLYQEGKYVPASYIIVWPRKKLISWANKIRHLTDINN